jgi:hypothetical protein
LVALLDNFIEIVRGHLMSGVEADFMQIVDRLLDALCFVKSIWQRISVPEEDNVLESMELVTE